MSRSWAAASPACTRRGCWPGRGGAWSLLERRRIGWGASGRNGGFVGPGYAQRSGALIDRLGLDHTRQLYAQSQRGVAIVRDAIAELGRPDILMGSGKLSVSRTDQGAGFADRTRKLADQLGASFEPWPTERMRSVLDTVRYHQAIHDPTSFHIHPLNFALALAADIERHGGTLHEDTEAVELDARRQRLAASHAARRRQGASCRAGRQCRSRRRTAAHRTRGAAGRDLRRRHRQARTLLSARRSAGRARSPTRAAPATITASSTATGSCGVVASPPTRPSRRACAR